jgi:hypothetical protein
MAVIEFALEHVDAEDGINKDDKAADNNSIGDCWHGTEEGADGEAERFCFRNLFKRSEGTEASQDFERAQDLIDLRVPELECITDIHGRVDANTHCKINTILPIHKVSFLTGNDRYKETLRQDAHDGFE